MRNFLIIILIALIGILSFFAIKFLFKKEEVRIKYYSLLNETAPIKDVKPQKIEVFVLEYKNKTLKISKVYFNSREEKEEYKKDIVNIILPFLNATMEEFNFDNLKGKKIIMRDEVILIFERENILIEVLNYTQDFRDNKIIKYFLKNLA
jgi:hypothetical protein